MYTVDDYWANFIRKNPDYTVINKPQALFYCDNKADADECAELVLKKIKQATSTSLWWFEQHKEPLPSVGDLMIVTNWDGDPKAIIKTIKVEVVKFKDITPAYAFVEGEGDKSLSYWRKVHWEFYKREMSEYDVQPTEDMELVCEYFETIF